MAAPNLGPYPLPSRPQELNHAVALGKTDVGLAPHLPWAGLQGTIGVSWADRPGDRAPDVSSCVTC